MPSPSQASGYEELMQNEWNNFGIFGKRHVDRAMDNHLLMARKRHGPGFVVHKRNPGFLIHKRPFLIHKRPMAKSFATLYSKRLWKPFATYHNLQKRLPFLVHKKGWKPYAFSGASKINHHKRDNKLDTEYFQAEKELEEVEKIIKDLLRLIAMENKDDALLPISLYERLKKPENDNEEFGSDKAELDKRLGKGTLLDDVALHYSYRFPRTRKNHDLPSILNDDNAQKQKTHSIVAKDCEDKGRKKCDTNEKNDPKDPDFSKKSFRRKRMDEWNASGMDSDTFNSKSA